MKEQSFSLNYPWDSNGYCPKTEFHLGMDSEGFHMHIIVEETDPRRVETAHLRDVYKDSCAEWFVNFFPEKCDRYFNFEVNANGAMYASFRKNRDCFQVLSVEEINELKIKARVNSDTWEVWYCVPFSLIKRYIPDFCCRDSMLIRANFYKCGDNTALPHYGLWNVYEAEQPDFHRPEHFGCIIMNLEKKNR